MEQRLALVARQRVAHRRRAVLAQLLTKQHEPSQRLGGAHRAGNRVRASGAHWRRDLSKADTAAYVRGPGE